MEKECIKIIEYNLKGLLPNPFVFDNGKSIEKKTEWDERRKEIFKTAVELQYGDCVPAPEFFDVSPLYIGDEGKISVYAITAGTKRKKLTFNMYVFKAGTTEKLPCAISGDLCFPYAFDKEYIDLFIKNKINLVLFNRTDLAPDIARYNLNWIQGENNSEYIKASNIIDNLEKSQKIGKLSEIYPEYSFGTIQAWAWGYSRCVDALEELSFADMDCIAFTGHSRGGKTAILAGALDERAAIVNPNAACAGGCSCYRIDITAQKEDGTVDKSEDMSNIFRHFPMWLGPEMKKYIGCEDKLPFDSHYLKALIAPRVLLVTEAASDIMANPVGTWQTSIAAKEVYKFLEAEEKMLWSFRSGGHCHSVEDVLQLVNVIKHFKWGEPLNDNYYKRPFNKAEPAFKWRTPQSTIESE